MKHFKNTRVIISGLSEHFFLLARVVRTMSGVTFDAYVCVLRILEVKSIGYVIFGIYKK